MSTEIKIKMEGTDETKCFICGSPSVPFALQQADETTVFDFLCKLFKFPGPGKGKVRLYHAIGNSEFCDSCIMFIREAMATCSQIQLLQNNLERMKIQLQKDLMANHYGSPKNDEPVSKNNSSMVRGMLAQCK